MTAIALSEPVLSTDEKPLTAEKIAERLASVLAELTERARENDFHIDWNSLKITIDQYPDERLPDYRMVKAELDWSAPPDWRPWT